MEAKGRNMDWNPTTHYQDVAVAERYDRERFSRISGRVFNALEKRAVRRAFQAIPRDRQAPARSPHPSGRRGAHT